MSATSETGTCVWLLAIDGSPRADYAAQYVAGIAGRVGVDEIIVISTQLPSAGHRTARQSAAIRVQAGVDAERATDQARRMLKAAGLAVRLHAPVGGDPAALIAAAGKRGEVAEIVMGTRGMSALRNVALGSVAYKVLHLARLPVTLVPSASQAAASRKPSGRKPLAVLLADDGSRQSHRAVDYVCRLASTCPLEVNLLNVRPRLAAGRVRSFVSRANLEAFYRQEGMAALRSAMRQLNRAGVRYRTHIKAGPTAETIVETAHENGCDRVVMGTRGLSAARALLLGSVTYGVVHRADLPVTVAK